MDKVTVLQEDKQKIQNQRLFRAITFLRPSCWIVFIEGVGAVGTNIRYIVPISSFFVSEIPPKKPNSFRLFGPQ
jgi:hypothetical protein